MSFDTRGFLWSLSPFDDGLVLILHFWVCLQYRVFFLCLRLVFANSCVVTVSLLLVGPLCKLNHPKEVVVIIRLASFLVEVSKLSFECLKQNLLSIHNVSSELVDLTVAAEN